MSQDAGPAAGSGAGTGTRSRRPGRAGTLLRLVVRRMLWAVPLLFVVSVTSFALMALVPGDPARAVLGPTASAEQVEALSREMGLDRPLPEQYAGWLDRAVHGDLGTSLYTGADVESLLRARLEPTVSLILLSALVAAVVGVLLGLTSAVRGGVLGRLVDVLSAAGLAVPSFWFALLLVSWFAVRWRVFPPTGYTPAGTSAAEWLRSLALPAAATALPAVTGMAKQTRDAVLDALHLSFVRVMQANGLSRSSILFRHVLRNAAGPILSLLGVITAGLLGATVLIENIFGLPGLGSAAALAALQHDIPVLQGTVITFTLIVIAIGLLVDVCQAWLDPRTGVR
ncbi:ABC transporter permease [Micromonospora chersina]|uniref:ABC transporter permease n=1 Tax=Micromonospora chersina TaxID=47854 RepID=UPI0033C84312